MKSILELLSEKFKNAFSELGLDEKYGQVVVSNRPDLCEYQCNGALAAAKQYKKAPIMIANDVVEKLKEDVDFLSIEAVMPGFINFNVSVDFLRSYVAEMAKNPILGFEKKSEGKTVVVDYGGPNIAKSLHVGHLRPAIIGETLKRMMKLDGYNTIGDAHLGDWGLQIGLIITELKARKPELVYFDENFTGEYPKEAPFDMAELEEIYPYASAYSKEHEDYKEAAKQATAELQNGKPAYIAIWQHVLDISIADLKKNYANLNVFFEVWGKESDASKIIPGMVDDLKARNITTMSEGALVVEVKTEQDTKEMPPCIILKSDGASLYASTDIATIVERKEKYNPDRIVYVVDKRQGLHFEQVFRVVRKAGYVNEDTELIFIGNGTMNGSDGKPFKTRSGGVMRLELLIQDVADKVLEKMSDRVSDPEEAKKIAKIVGLAALKYGDLSNQATKDYVFDLDRFTSFEGNTGPYLLYTMVRIKSIVEKYTAAEGGSFDELLKKLNAGELSVKNNSGSEQNESETKLMLGLAAFSQSMRNAIDELAPHRICSFMFELSDLFNSFYHENKIISELDNAVKERWIALSLEVYVALKQCTELLAIDVPDRM